MLHRACAARPAAVNESGVARLSPRSLPVVAGAVLAVLLAGADLRAGVGRELPAKFRKAPYALMSLSVGAPNAGWQLRGKKLKKTPHLRIKAGSESNVYGHPALVLMLRRSAKEIARVAPGSSMLVGDLSSKPGGPLAGHRSHQSGRDADVGFFAIDRSGKRVNPERFVHFGKDGKALDGSGVLFDDWRNWLLVQSWVRDQRAGLSHIFVSAGLRLRLLRFAQSRPAFRAQVPEVAALLKQPEDSSPHDDHFHVRIACPARQQELCREESR
jgi:penicillin-insensitive murein DD-endopeptidase